MAIGGFQQNAFQQDAFQIEASDNTYSFSNDPQFVSKVSARATIAAALSVTFSGFVFVPPAPTPAVSAPSSDVIIQRKIIYQANANVVPPLQPVVPPTLAVSIESDLVSYGAVFNQHISGVLTPPPAAAVPPVVSAQSSDLIRQRNVIYQAVANVPQPPVVSLPPTLAVSIESDLVSYGAVINQTVSGVPPPIQAAPVTQVFAETPVFIVSRRPKAVVDGFVSAPVLVPAFFGGVSSDIVASTTVIYQDKGFTSPPAGAVWSFSQPEVALALKKAAQQSDAFVSPIAGATPTPATFWFGAQVEVFARPFKREWVGFVSAPVTVTWSFSQSELALPPKKPAQQADPFISPPTGVAPTPSAFWFGAQVEVFARPFKREWAGFIPPPTVAIPSGWFTSESPSLLAKRQVQDVAGFVFSPPTATWSFGLSPELTQRPKAPASPDGFISPPTGVAPTPTFFWFGAQVEIVKKPTRIEQPGFEFLPPVAAALPPFFFGESPSPHLSVAVIAVPDGQTDQQQQPPTPIWPFGPSPEITKKPSRIEQPGFAFNPPFVAPPVVVLSAISSDITFRRTIIYQANAVAPIQPPIVGPIPPVWGWSSEQVSPHLSTGAVITPDSGFQEPPPPTWAFGPSPELFKQPSRIEQLGFALTPPFVAPPVVVLSAISSDITFQRQIIYQANAVAPVVPAGVVTPSAFWFGEQPIALKKPTRIEQPSFTFVAPGVVTPSAFWFGEQPALLKKPTRIEQPGYFTPAPPAPWGWSAQDFWQRPPQLKVTPDQAPLITAPTVPVPATWPWSPSPELFKKPVPRDQDPLTLPFPNPVPVPAFYSWSASPERVIKPTPLLTPSADISFQLSVTTPSAWYWSASPEVLKKPTRIEQPGFEFVQPPTATPSAFWFGAQVELLKKPTRIEQPGFEFNPPQLPWGWSQQDHWQWPPRVRLVKPDQDPLIPQPPPTPTPAALVLSPSPELIKKPTRVEQPGFFNVFPPPVITPSSFPWSAPPEVHIRPLNVVLQQHTSWTPIGPPPSVVIAPPGAGKKKYRRPHGAQKLHLQPRQRVIYRSDDYGLRFPVGLFEALEREPEAEAPAAPEAGAEEAPRFEREVVPPPQPLGQPEIAPFQHAFGQPTVTQAPLQQPPPLPTPQAPSSLEGTFGQAPTLEALDDEDAIAALEALDQLDDPMFNLIIDHLINMLKNG